MMRSIAPAFLAALLASSLTMPAPAADAPGSLGGAVRDESGAPLAGATVTATDLAGKSHEAQASSDGSFAIEGLEAGPYRVTATLGGFVRQTEHVLVDPGQRAGVDFGLRLLPLEELVASASKKVRSAREAPATVYVISEAMIRERGYSYLYEALREAPGLDITWMGGLYGPILMPRGLDSPENNKLLLLVDGIVDNNLSAGTAQVYMQYSLQNVKRIEVIYGPASALYGANAMGGLINIITRTGADLEGVRVQAGSMAWDSRVRRTGNLAGAALGRTWGEEGKKVDVAASFHVVDTDGPDLKLDDDTPRSDIPSDPAGANYWFSPDYIGSGENGTIMAQARASWQGPGLSLGGYLWNHRGGQGTYGHEGFVFLNSLQNKIDNWNFRNAAATLGHQHRFSTALTNQADLTYRSTTLTNGYDLYYNRTGTGPDGPGDAGTAGSRYYRPDHSWKLSDTLTWDVGETQSLTAGVSAEFQRVSDYMLTTGHSFANQQFLQDAPKPAVDDSRRYDYRDYSAFAEHVWTISEKLTLTTGGRIDVFELQGDRTPSFFGTNDRNPDGTCLATAPDCVTAQEVTDAGAIEVSRVFYLYGPLSQTTTTVNPRVGAVWKAAPRVTLKALYGEGFRVPTVRELFSVSGSRYSNPDLGPEKIRTGELTGVYEITDRGHVEANLYYTKAEALIQLTPSEVKRPGRTSFLNQFRNAARLHVTGFEVKGQYAANEHVDLFGHYSFESPQYDEADPGALSHDTDSASPTAASDRIPRQSGHKGEAGLSLAFANRRFVITPRVKFVGARPGVITSPIAEVDSYSSFDVSGLVRDVGLKGLSLQLAVYNVANADILDPGFRTGVKTSDFPAAHPQPGIHGFFKINYRRDF